MTARVQMSVLSSFRVRMGGPQSVPRYRIGAVRSPATCQRPGRWPNSSGGNSTWLSLRAVCRGVNVPPRPATYVPATTLDFGRGRILKPHGGVLIGRSGYARWKAAGLNMPPMDTANPMLLAGSDTAIPSVDHKVRSSLMPRRCNSRFVLSPYATGSLGSKGYAIPIMNVYAQREVSIPIDLSRVARTEASQPAQSQSAETWRLVKASVPSTITDCAGTEILLRGERLENEAVYVMCQVAMNLMKDWDSASFTMIVSEELANLQVVEEGSTNDLLTMCHGTKVNRLSTPVKCAMCPSQVDPVEYADSVLGPAWLLGSEVQVDHGGTVALNRKLSKYASPLSTKRGGKLYLPGITLPAKCVASQGLDCTPTIFNPSLPSLSCGLSCLTGALYACRVTWIPQHGATGVTAFEELLSKLHDSPARGTS